MRKRPTTLHGTAIFPGIAYGRCQQFSSEDLEIPQFNIEETAVRGEIQRLRNAVNAVDKELGILSEQYDEDEMPIEAIAFVDVHRTIIKDNTFIDRTVSIIRERLINAEWALSIRLDRIRRDFELIEDDYLRQRIADIAFVVSRIQRTLAGRRSRASLLAVDGNDDPLILIADSLDPADILQLRERDDLDVVGILLEEGNTTSHTAILARSLEIPTMVGVRNLCASLNEEQIVILNATDEVVTVRPSSAEIKLARSHLRASLTQKKKLKQLKAFSGKTKDNENVTLLANIALPEDTRDVHNAGADGIGLFRTEFLFLNRSTLPTEDEQVRVYQHVSRSMRQKHVVIRLADLGGDKTPERRALSFLTDDYEYMQSSLGLRAMRFNIRYPRILRTQLRSILRANTQGNFSILLPLISSIEEIHYVRTLLQSLTEELTQEGYRFKSQVPLGGMIEIPSAIIMLPEFINRLDFFSLGTNDLVQYALGVDRTNSAVAEYYDEYHPGVLRLIAQCIRKIIRSGKTLCVCGEMASRLHFLPFFIGLGCRQLSMDSSVIPWSKEHLLRLTTARCELLAQKVLRRHTSKSIKTLLMEFDKSHRRNLQNHESII